MSRKTENEEGEGVEQPFSVELYEITCVLREQTLQMMHRCNSGAVENGLSLIEGSVRLMSFAAAEFFGARELPDWAIGFADTRIVMILAVPWLLSRSFQVYEGLVELSEFFNFFVCEEWVASTV